MGTTGGGVWRTRDGGNNWVNISDGYFGGSIGAVEVCPLDPLLIYVGTGENTLRGNVSEGKGMYKSTDGGKTWQWVGLGDTRHITKIIFHPKNPDIVYCTATGHLFGSNTERGVFKTINGGKTWNKILYIDEYTGCIDMAMDPANPEILYTSSWQVLRTPYSMESGGSGSGLWKSNNGGDNWEKISSNKGFPNDTLGNIGISIAPSNTDILYAIVESKKGGLYKSIDAGKSWTKQNDESKIRQRGWYFNKVFADPKNENIVYIHNVELYKSIDGGKTLQTIRTPHVDHHNMWIDPEDPNRMIIANDGGAQISFDGGQNWSTYLNQATGQFYRVTTDNHFPYHILGCQQDNTSVRIKSRSKHGSIGQHDWNVSAGFESGHIVSDPSDPDIVYGGNYGGYLSRLNHRTGENRTVSVYPVSPIGEGADSLKYRFQWNFPIFFSPHNPKRLYAAGNKLFVTENEGQSWKAISPDLTTNDKSKQAPSGGPIAKDNTSVEYYCTIFAAAESPAEKDLLWCGSDDGLIHVSRNGGTSWSNVSPHKMPDWMMINCIEPHPTDPSICYVVGTRYKLDDNTPYIYKTTDFGRSWKLITKGIASDHFTRCLRIDPKDPNILYAGTEQGLYISTNEGALWQSFQLNLPIVPITDLAIKNDDLIVATQGRSFWVLDHLSFIREIIHTDLDLQKIHLFDPGLSYRTEGYRQDNPKNEGLNPHTGVRIQYWLPEWKESDKLRIHILSTSNKILRTYTNSGDKKDKLPADKGMNLWSWNTMVKGVEPIEGMIMWNGTIRDFKVPPGEYSLALVTPTDSITKKFNILNDPNYTTSVTDYVEQFDFLTSVRNKFEETQECIKSIRLLRLQLTELKEKMKPEDYTYVDSNVKFVLAKMEDIESNLYQTKAKSGQDVLNYPIRLNDKLSGIFNAANQHTAPTLSVREAFDDIQKLTDLQLNSFKNLVEKDIKTLNQIIRSRELDYIMIKK